MRKTPHRILLLALGLALLLSACAGPAAQSAQAQEETASGVSASVAQSAPPSPAQHAPAAVQKNGRLVVAVAQNNAPYCFAKQGGEQTGLDLVVADLLGQGLGVQSSLLFCADAAEVQKKVAAGEADVGLAGPALAGADGVQLCRPYAGGDQCLVLRVEDVKLYASLDDFKGKVVSLQRSEGQQKLLEELLPLCQLTRSATTENCIKKLRAGACSAVLMSRMEALYYTGEAPDLGLCTVELAGKAQPESACPAVMQGNHALQSALEEALQQAEGTGALGGMVEEAVQQADLLHMLPTE